MDQNKKSGFARSDLACERERFGPGAAGRYDYEEGGFHVTELTVDGDAVADTGDDSGRSAAGKYITVDIGKIWLESDEKAEECACLLADKLSGFVKSAVGERAPEEMCIMIAGLGNRFITADALGPLTVDKLTVTRHVMGQGGVFDRMGCSKICAVQPGVLGQTGIEAAAIIKGAAEEAKPDLVIAVDALAARSVDRLATTVQISDGGICPGSGIGNRRVAINEESIGCPVIALGVPTVVDSSTLVWDALDEAGIEDISDTLHGVLENGRSFFVSPKESDVIIEETSELLASALCKVAGL